MIEPAPTSIWGVLGRLAGRRARRRPGDDWVGEKHRGGGRIDRRRGEFYGITRGLAEALVAIAGVPAGDGLPADAFFGRPAILADWASEVVLFRHPHGFDIGAIVSRGITALFLPRKDDAGDADLLRFYIPAVAVLVDLLDLQLAAVAALGAGMAGRSVPMVASVGVFSPPVRLEREQAKEKHDRCLAMVHCRVLRDEWRNGQR